MKTNHRWFAEKKHPHLHAQSSETLNVWCPVDLTTIQNYVICDHARYPCPIQITSSWTKISYNISISAQLKINICGQSLQRWQWELSIRVKEYISPSAHKGLSFIGNKVWLRIVIAWNLSNTKTLVYWLTLKVGSLVASFHPSFPRSINVTKNNYFLYTH